MRIKGEEESPFLEREELEQVPVNEFIMEAKEVRLPSFIKGFITMVFKVKEMSPRPK